MQQICVYLRSSAVYISDKLRLHRFPIGAPNSVKYLAQSSYEFVLSSLFIFTRCFAFPVCFAVNNVKEVASGFLSAPQINHS